MPTNFELKRLKPKLDIVKKPENRVHKLTDSNVSRLGRSLRKFSRSCLLDLAKCAFSAVKLYFSALVLT